MKQVCDKLKNALDAATTTYLNTAYIVRGDKARTQYTGSGVYIEVIPLPSEDTPIAIGSSGWYDTFRVHIKAHYPATWSETDKQLDLAEEVKQVIRDNWSWLNTSNEQAVLKRRRWGYGYDASGEQTINTVDVIVEYEGPGLGATPPSP